MTEIERQEKIDTIKRMVAAGNPCWAILALIEVIEADRGGVTKDRQIPPPIEAITYQDLLGMGISQSTASRCIAELNASYIPMIPDRPTSW